MKKEMVNIDNTRMYLLGMCNKGKKIYLSEKDILDESLSIYYKGETWFLSNIFRGGTYDNDWLATPILTGEEMVYLCSVVRSFLSTTDIVDFYYRESSRFQNLTTESIDNDMAEYLDRCKSREIDIDTNDVKYLRRKVIELLKPQ